MEARIAQDNASRCRCRCIRHTVSSARGAAARKPDLGKVYTSARIATVSGEFRSRGTARRAVKGLSVRPTLAEVPLGGLSFRQLF